MFCKLVLGGPRPNWGLWWFLAILGVMVIVAKVWLRWAQLWFWTHLALRASSLPPFGLYGLGQNGPDWPTGHRGPRPPNESGWPKDDGYG
ncbi:hypothetical protein O181_086380 [Austropuccinia psidii MF-1]|uniref:Uncharacterized protein n=1 Tax=Austropuccinia psidii MF-1 TaxID=1389203 RepID=A0A9Q3FZ67_9BASI|nr:hypothetical protein [Austropuccinia psidii MF-1]